jgi:hypothetical protein
MLMDGHDTGKGDLRKLVDSMMMSWVDAKEGIKITRVGHCLSPWGPTATRPTLQHRRSGGERFREGSNFQQVRRITAALHGAIAKVVCCGFW